MDKDEQTKRNSVDDDAPEINANEKIRGKRLILLILAIVSSTPLLLIFRFVWTDPVGTLAFLLLYGWAPALLWWLTFRKGRNSSRSPENFGADTDGTETGISYLLKMRKNREAVEKLEREKRRQKELTQTALDISLPWAERLAAAQEIENHTEREKTYIQIACTDWLIPVRLAAAEQIAEQKTLVEIAVRNKNSRVGDAAASRLDDEHLQLYQKSEARPLCCSVIPVEEIPDMDGWTPFRATFTEKSFGSLPALYKNLGVRTLPADCKWAAHEVRQNRSSGTQVEIGDARNAPEASLPVLTVREKGINGSDIEFRVYKKETEFNVRFEFTTKWVYKEGIFNPWITAQLLELRMLSHDITFSVDNDELKFGIGRYGINYYGTYHNDKFTLTISMDRISLRYSSGNEALFNSLAEIVEAYLQNGYTPDDKAEYERIARKYTPVKMTTSTQFSGHHDENDDIMCLYNIDDEVFAVLKERTYASDGMIAWCKDIIAQGASRTANSVEE